VFVSLARIASGVVDEPHRAVGLIVTNLEAVVVGTRARGACRHAYNQKQHRNQYFSHPSLLLEPG
jgi:hypothetical protein